jgi:hypothetical protein
MRLFYRHFVVSTWFFTVLLLSSCGSDSGEAVDLKSIRDCAELEVAEFSFHKIIVERSRVSALGIRGKGFASLPEKTLILPVDVSVVGKIDFSDVTDDNLIVSEDGVTFVLPDPTFHVLSVQPDYKVRGKASREQWYRGGRFSDEEIRKFAEQACDSIMKERTLQMMADRTRDNAASILIPLVSSVTGTSMEKVTIQFRSDFNISAATLNDGNIIIFKRKE